jgi:hypothetical protein
MCARQHQKATPVNGSQLFVMLFAVMVSSISLWSVIVVIQSPILKLKPLWIIGCLFGIIGFGIDWTTPDDIILLFGITIPVVMVFKVVATGHVIVKTGFPIVSIVALFKARGHIRTNGG